MLKNVNKYLDDVADLSGMTFLTDPEKLGVLLQEQSIAPWSTP